MKVIGQAGTGVDNVDIPATQAGIIVITPESNSVAAARHTMAPRPGLFHQRAAGHFRPR